MKPRFYCNLVVIIFGSVLVSQTQSHNITNIAFGEQSGVVAAFGDFNSDELTDIFLITNNSKTLQVLYGKFPSHHTIAID